MSFLHFFWIFLRRRRQNKEKKKSRRWWWWRRSGSEWMGGERERKLFTSGYAKYSSCWWIIAVTSSLFKWNLKGLIQMITSIFHVTRWTTNSSFIFFSVAWPWIFLRWLFCFCQLENEPWMAQTQIASGQVSEKCEWVREITVGEEGKNGCSREKQRCQWREAKVNTHPSCRRACWKHYFRSIFRTADFCLWDLFWASETN